MVENIFTLKEVEAILKKSTKPVKHLLKTKRLAYSRVDGRIRVSERQLDDFFKLIGRLPLKKQMMAK